MANKKSSKIIQKSRRDTKKGTVNGNFWQDSYANIILGAIIVIIFGLLVANYFTNRAGKINSNGQRDKIEFDQTEKESEEQKALANDYKIVSGDTLGTISNKFYNDQKYWLVIAKANNIQNPNLIYADTQLKVPSKDEADNMLDNYTKTSYSVKSGDTLFKIAQDVYGNGSLWQTIFKANKLSYLPNGNPLILSGSTLIIPR